MNQSHLTVGNYQYVTYEKSETGRGCAWDHLLKNPPPGLVLPGVPIHVLNPYRKNHTDTQWRWRVLSPAEIEMLLEEVEAEEEAETRVFDPKIWKSISNKYRTVARLPEGMTGKQAMKWAHEEYAKIFEYQNPLNESWDERMSEGHFLRVFTIYPFAKHCQAELTQAEWRAFKQAGGQSA